MAVKLSQRILAYTQAHPEVIIRAIATHFAVPHSVVMKAIQGKILCSAPTSASSS